MRKLRFIPVLRDLLGIEKAIHFCPITRSNLKFLLQWRFIKLQYIEISGGINCGARDGIVNGLETFTMRSMQVCILGAAIDFFT